MITIESQPKPRSPYWIPRSWLFFIALAVLPFFLRIHLDMQQTGQQAVQTLYREWRWSPQGRNLATGTQLIFHRVNDKNTSEDLFLRQVQKDFKMAEVGQFPQIIALFEEGEDLLRTRIELRNPGPNSVPMVWEGETRLTGNGILLGPWTSSLLLVLGKSVGMSAGVGALVTLLWDTGWSPLDLPARVFDFFSCFLSEIKVRALRGDWVATEMGRVPVIGLIFWILPALFALLKFFPRLNSRGLYFFILASFIVEPLILGTSQLFGKWGMGASWWKVYLGSFSYRFVIFTFLASFYLRPRAWLEEKEQAPRFASPWLLALPLSFIAAGGWEWLGAALAPGVGETLLRFRVFIVGFLVAFVLGSRIFSMWLAIFAWAVFSPPTTGHWNSSALYGLLVDGLFLGWWLSPFKSVGSVVSFGSKSVIILSLMAWITGVLLSSVGVPLGICWLALAAGVWGYNQVIVEPSDEKSDEAESTAAT